MSLNKINKKCFFIHFILALALSYFVLSAALYIALSQTSIYPSLSEPVENTYNLDQTVIEANYRNLISYNLNPCKNQLTFQGLPSSSGGLSHFIEVKAIFWKIFISGFLSGILPLVAIIYCFQKRIDPEFLRYAFRVSFFLSLVTGFSVLTGFDRIFTAFHETIFSNDLWLFNPKLDGIILYLPTHFFQRIAILILGLWLGILMIIRWPLYLLFKRKNSISYNDL
jgi:integral membrane protein (TIGR01906 family)